MTLGVGGAAGFFLGNSIILPFSFWKNPIPVSLPRLVRLLCKKGLWLENLPKMLKSGDTA